VLVLGGGYYGVGEDGAVDKSVFAEGWGVVDDRVECPVDVGLIGCGSVEGGYFDVVEGDHGFGE